MGEIYIEMNVYFAINIAKLIHSIFNPLNIDMKLKGLMKIQIKSKMAAKQNSDYAI